MFRFVSYSLIVIFLVGLLGVFITGFTGRTKLTDTVYGPLCFVSLSTLGIVVLIYHAYHGTAVPITTSTKILFWGRTRTEVVDPKANPWKWWSIWSACMLLNVVFLSFGIWMRSFMQEYHSRPQPKPESRTTTLL